MSGIVTSEDIVTAVTEATEEVFSTMLNLPLEKLNPQTATSEPPGSDGVVALVGIGGSWTGSGRIGCSKKAACKLAGALLMSNYPEVDEEVLDAMAEVANMVIGNVKTNFEGKLGPLGLSVPTVVFGRNYYTRSAGVQNWMVMPFRTGEDELEIRFCLMPSQTTQSRVERLRPQVVA
ncbi:MAG: chemotaxis protein CheX [Acidobacteria bacterium]|nr:chemotaxis protein CheX [Acidobacteriota bacterium]